MAREASRLDVPGPIEALREALTRLGQGASIEINVQDLADLEPSRQLLPAGTRVYVSHLPKQAVDDTLKVCAAAKRAGFDPVPHVPVRLLHSQDELDEMVGKAVAIGVKELLLIAGDYAHALGPYGSVPQVLRAVDLGGMGIERISVGGHPEGHTKVPLDEIRRAEIEKAQIAREQGLAATILTQFFFESAPFLQWSQALHSAGVTADIRAGLAGPAKITTLLRFAMRCGVGPSVKALSSRPAAFAKLFGEHGPEHLLVQLANAVIERPSTFHGLHLFCFGGYLRTCRWLHGLSSGNFVINASGELVMT